LHPQEDRHTLRRHQGKGDPGLVVIKEWWSLNDEICEVADRFARARAPTS
jgi:dienelactone hydrolase